MKQFKIKDYKDIIKDWKEYVPLKQREAIMAKCYDCCCYQRKEVKLCNSVSCPLYQFKEKYYNKNNIFKITNI